MQREFKFRAYHLVNKKYVPIIGFDLEHADYVIRIEGTPVIVPMKILNVQQSTGLKDKQGKEIYEGDILSDWNEVDGNQVQSKLQVYWCEKTGAWKLDHSFNQDKSSGDLLCEELSDFAYEITGNVYQRQSV